MFKEFRQDVAIIRRLIRDYLWNYKLAFAIAIGAMVLLAVSTAWFALLLEPILNGISTGDRSVMWPVIIGVVLLQFSKAVGLFIQGYVTNAIGSRFVADVQKDLIRNLYAMDIKRGSNVHSGHFLTTTIQFVGQISRSATSVLTTLTRDVLQVILLVGVMIYQDWLLASIALIVVPFLVLNVQQQTKIIKKTTRKTMSQSSALTSLLSDILVGSRIVKAFGTEDREVARAGKVIEERYRVNLRGLRAQAVTVPVSEVATGFGLAAVLAYSFYSPTFDLGSFGSFVAATLAAFQPMRNLSKLATDLATGTTAARKVFEELDEKPQVVDDPEAVELNVTKGGIEFDNLTFTYGEDVAALNGVTFEAPALKRTALVGPSGAGKSTIFNLLMRFYDPQEGAIRIDGQNIKGVTQQSLRSQIAFVNQDPFLFDDTVRDNIAYGVPHATDEDIVEAAKAADAHEFILTLPMGYDTRVGERGGLLSGGQRQRIAIARAILKQAPILLLDEATSSLDSESEAQIQGALRRLMDDRTVLVIAHRLSTVIDADQIVVFDRGDIVEIGTHDELLSDNGLYAKLYRTQFSGHSDAVAAQ